MRLFTKALKDVLLWIYWYPFRGVLQVVPIDWLPTLSRGIGRVMAVVAVRRRKELTGVMARIPMLAALPNRKQHVIKAFQDRIFNELEMLLYTKLTVHNIERFVEWQGKYQLDQALEKGSGVMMIFAHFGANQMVMPAVGYSGYTMCQMSASPLVWKSRLKHKSFSRMEEKALELRWKQELSLPVRHIDIFSSLKSVFSCLSRNEILGIAIDGAGGKDWVEVDFLGTKAQFSTGAMRIASRCRCLVLPTFMVRNSKGLNEIVIFPPLEGLAGADDKESLKNTIQQLVHLLEEYVVAHPHHYLHFLALRHMTAEKEGEPPLLLSTPS